LFLIQLAQSQIELGGGEEEVRDKERLDWDQVLEEMLSTAGGIGAVECKAMAVRQLACRLWQRDPRVAASLANRVEGAEPPLEAQQSALRIAWNKPVAKDAPLDWDKEVTDPVARVAHAEGNARLGKFAEARRVALAKGPDLHQLVALAGVADV